MFSVICLMLSFFFATSAFLAWEKVYNTWALYAVLAVVFFCLYGSQIQS